MVGHPFPQRDSNSRLTTLSGYTNVGVIPVGARDILVKEVEEAGNFLALKSDSSEEYFLNGNYIIQWNGEYVAGGTTFYYERSGNMENLTAPGPTRQPVMLQVGFYFFFSTFLFLLSLIGPVLFFFPVAVSGGKPRSEV